MLPLLYPHQSEMVQNLRLALSSHRAAIAQAPPGTGKTRMAKWIAGNSIANPPNDRQSGNVLFAVHRRSLVDNASDSFNEDPPLRHGVVMSGRNTHWQERLQVASIDTLVSWHVDRLEYTTDHTFDLVIFDECHASTSTLIRWLRAHDAKRKELGLNQTLVLGLSATPEGKELSALFGNIVQGPSPGWLIENGFLSPFRYVRATEGRLSELKVRAGEYTAKSQDTAYQGLSGDLVRDWRKFAADRPTVGFFHRLSYAKEARNELRRHGIKAEYVDGSTPDDERRQLFKDLDSGRIQYLCNVGVVERGTNIPGIACVDLCLSVKSLKRFLQMIGRGSRACPGKADCLVIDHGGNIREHGFFEDDRQWVLSADKIQTGVAAQRPTIECPQCQRIYRGGFCTHCAYEPQKAERKSQGLEWDGAELVEIKREEKPKPKGKTAEQLMVSALYRGGRSGKTFAQCCAIYRQENKKQGTNYSVPKTVTVGGRDYRMLPYGHPDSSRRAKHIFEFLK